MRTKISDPQNPMLDRDPDEPQDLSEQDFAAREARQGKLGRPVLAVLVTALALAFVVWAGVSYWGKQLPDGPENGTTAATQSEPAAGNGNQSATPPAATSDTAPVTTPAPDRDPTPQSGSGGGATQPSSDGTVQ